MPQMALNPSSIELEALFRPIIPTLLGMRLDKVFVSKHPNFEPEYISDEITLQLGSREVGAFFIHLRFKPQQVLIGATKEGTLSKAANKAPKSPFMQMIMKYLEGLYLSGLKLGDENRGLSGRILGLEFSAAGGSPAKKPGKPDYILYISLIPARPLLWLEDQDHQFLGCSRWDVKARPDILKQPSRGAPEKSVREYFHGQRLSLKKHLYSEALELLHFQERTQKLEKVIRDQIKSVEKTLKHQRQLQDRSAESSKFFLYGQLLTSQLSSPQLTSSPGSTNAKSNSIRVHNWETNQEIDIPIPNQLTLKQAAQSYFEKAKSLQKKEGSTRQQVLLLEERLKATQKWNEALQQAREKASESARSLPWDLLLKIERQLLGPTPHENSKRTGKSGSQTAIPGALFHSREGLPILVGRGKTENLELTLRYAKGNDLWFHLQGLPSPHVVILLRDKKNASLDTMIDAAQLCLYFSKYRGHTQTFSVDYTHRKYVKRIQGSDEVSYTQNKTLMIQLDEKRIEELKKQSMLDI